MAGAINFDFSCEGEHRLFISQKGCEVYLNIKSLSVSS